MWKWDLYLHDKSVSVICLSEGSREDVQAAFRTYAGSTSLHGRLLSRNETEEISIGAEETPLRSGKPNHSPRAKAPLLLADQGTRPGSHLR